MIHRKTTSHESVTIRDSRIMYSHFRSNDIDNFQMNSFAFSTYYIIEEKVVFSRICTLFGMCQNKNRYMDKVNRGYEHKYIIEKSTIEL